MKKPIADQQFISEYYGSEEAFRLAVQSDYCKEQLTWSYYLDALCKNGEITQHQYDTWAFPGNKYR